jgi:hypothetical protein
VSVVRSFERRLERLLDGVAGRVFTGRLHPTEIAGRLAREADFARYEHETGPATANLYTILVNPADLATEPSELEKLLTRELERHTAEHGLRLEGPCRVVITATGEVQPGSIDFRAEVAPGPPVAWARLTAGTDMVEVGRNRAVVGRSSAADVSLAFDDVSRRHALIWREGSRAWVRDLGSSNGTFVDGRRVGDGPVELGTGSVVGFGPHRYRFTVA